MAKTKKFSDFIAISFVFWDNIPTGLGDPLGCFDLSQFFFGSSPIVIEWDKIISQWTKSRTVYGGRHAA